ncbi:MAG: hypothetical protein GY839_09540 [candidate division Zixibacteria bacterium]|nr:hypothetical protein [candidate division Zixibacteria bacterium]
MNLTALSAFTGLKKPGDEFCPYRKTKEIVDMKTFLRICLIAAMMFSFNIIADAQTLIILVWDNDNDSYYTDPGDGQVHGSEYGIQRALQDNFVNYSTVTSLPTDLSSYDIVFVALGIYCVG